MPPLEKNGVLVNWASSQVVPHFCAPMPRIKNLPSANDQLEQSSILKHGPSSESQSASLGISRHDVKRQLLLDQASQPALRITARLKKSARQIQVMRFRVASALLALLNIELPLAASPPMPSPFGLCSNTRRISSRPVPIQIQERTEVSMVIKQRGACGPTSAHCRQG